MAGWTSGGLWLLERKRDMISSTTEDGSWATIHDNDPASRGGAPDSRPVSAPNIRLPHTAGGETAIISAQAQRPAPHLTHRPRNAFRPGSQP